MKPYTDKTDKIDDRKCLYSEIKANDKPRKKAARRKAKRDIDKDDSLNVTCSAPIKCDCLAHCYVTAAGMTSGGLRVQNFQNTIQNERRYKLTN